MRFVARTPREDINVSNEHPLKDATILTIGLAAALFLITAIIVSFIDIVIFFVSPQTEMEIFSDFQISNFLQADFDHPSAESLERLTVRLAQHWPDVPYEFTLGVLDNEIPNAIALPGGTILVTRGLLADVESENEVAFVLGHELGHFKNRDHLRQLGRGFALGLILLLIGGQDGGFVSSSVFDIASRDFGRQQESDADLFALRLVNDEYGHVAGATAFFERLLKRNSSLANIAGYFSTHPAPGDRVDRLREEARSQGWASTGPISTLDF